MNEIENYFRLNIVKMKKINKRMVPCKNAHLMVQSFFIFIKYIKGEMKHESIKNGHEKCEIK